MPKTLTTNLFTYNGHNSSTTLDKILSIPKKIEYKITQKQSQYDTSGETRPGNIITSGITMGSHITADMIPSLPSGYSGWSMCEAIEEHTDTQTGGLWMDVGYCYSSTPAFTFGSYAYGQTLSNTMNSAGIGGAQCYYIIYGNDNNVYGLTPNWSNCCPVEIGGFCASPDGLILYDYSSFYLDDNWGSTVNTIFSNGDTSAISQLPFGVSNVQELGEYIYNHL